MSFIAYRVLWPFLFILCLLISSLFVSWQTQSKLDFFYPFLYEQMDIAENISKYAPQNTNKFGFEFTGRLEHISLFHQINQAVHAGSEHAGSILSAIQYHHERTGLVMDSLLHEREVIHLVDVATIIDAFFVAGCIVVTVLLALLFLQWRWPAPFMWRAAVLAWGVVLSAFGLACYFVGPTKVFYAWHEWAFPANNQWFFYYQDSLMTTLMKAPDLFGAIALTLVGQAACLVVVFLVCFSLLRKR